jgi:putative transposase
MTNGNRRTIRLRGHDYSGPGYYFVTICIAGKIRFFGHLKNSRVILNNFGLIAHREWINTAHIRVGVRLDAFIVMPDHVHGILKIQNDGCAQLVRAIRRVALFLV